MLRSPAARRRSALVGLLVLGSVALPLRRAGAAGPDTQPRPAAGSGPVLDLMVGGKSERLGPARLDALAHKVSVAGVKGDVWPLREVVGKKTGGKAVASVTVEGGDGERYAIDADEWRGDHLLYVRVNARGLFKFEGEAGGKRFGDVRDVKRIDVKLK